MAIWPSRSGTKKSPRRAARRRSSLAAIAARPTAKRAVRLRLAGRSVGLLATTANWRNNFQFLFISPPFPFDSDVSAPDRHPRNSPSICTQNEPKKSTFERRERGISEYSQIISFWLRVPDCSHERPGFRVPKLLHGLEQLLIAKFTSQTTSIAVGGFDFVKFPSMWGDSATSTTFGRSLGGRPPRTLASDPRRRSVQQTIPMDGRAKGRWKLLL